MTKEVQLPGLTPDMLRVLGILAVMPYGVKANVIYLNTDMSQYAVYRALDRLTTLKWLERDERKLCRITPDGGKTRPPVAVGRRSRDGPASTPRAHRSPNRTGCRESPAGEEGSVSEPDRSRSGVARSRRKARASERLYQEAGSEVGER